MRHIEKGTPPDEIVPYRHDEQTSFADFREKDAVRRALVDEQGALCCYCLKSIRPDEVSMKIEHWAPQSVEQGRRYDWSNLLGACPGGTTGDARHQTCDTRKGSTPITVNPTVRSHVSRVLFRGDGTVHSDDGAIQQDLNHALNLNDTTLVEARKQRVDSVLDGLNKKHKGKWTRTMLERELDKWRPARVTGRLPTFCEVVAQEIERRLRRA